MSGVELVSPVEWRVGGVKWSSGLETRVGRRPWKVGRAARPWTNQAAVTTAAVLTIETYQGPPAQRPSSHHEGGQVAGPVSRSFSVIPAPRNIKGLRAVCFFLGFLHESLWRLVRK